MLVILPNAFGDAATNMAIDTALLETLPEETAVFRHYGWTQPCCTFGYSQRYSEVAAHAPDGATLCRRMTGGGIVDHRNDWTYALIMNQKAACAGLSSTELYAEIHTALSEALAEQDILTQLAPCPRKCDEAATIKTGPDQCFIQPVMNDVLHPKGAKVAGAAMKRTRKGLLIQGSIDREALPVDLDLEVFSQSFATLLARSLKLLQKQPDDLRPYFQSQVIDREKEKFASDAWLKRR